VDNICLDIKHHPKNLPWFLCHVKLETNFRLAQNNIPLNCYKVFKKCFNGIFYCLLTWFIMLHIAKKWLQLRPYCFTEMPWLHVKRKPGHIHSHIYIYILYCTIVLHTLLYPFLVIYQAQYDFFILYILALCSVSCTSSIVDKMLSTTRKWTIYRI